MCYTKVTQLQKYISHNKYECINICINIGMCVCVRVYLFTCAYVQYLAWTLSLSLDARRLSAEPDTSTHCPSPPPTAQLTTVAYVTGNMAKSATPKHFPLQQQQQQHHHHPSLLLSSDSLHFCLLPHTHTLPYLCGIATLMLCVPHSSSMQHVACSMQAGSSCNMQHGATSRVASSHCNIF